MIDIGADLQRAFDEGYEKGKADRPQGEWVENSPVTIKCNQCGYVIPDWKWLESKFCANCGARMKGADDE